MSTVTGYRVTAGRVHVECRDEKGAFEVAAKLTDSTHPSYSGSHSAQVDIVLPDGGWWTIGTANCGNPYKFPPPIVREPAQQNPSFATQVADDGTQSGRSATEQGSVNCVAKPERMMTMHDPSSFEVPVGWVMIAPEYMERVGQSGPKVVCVPVHQILEFASDYAGVTVVKTALANYVTKKSPAEFAQQVSTAQVALMASLRAALEGLGVKER